MTTRRKAPKKAESFAAGVGRGLRRAARTARGVARVHCTSILHLEKWESRCQGTEQRWDEILKLAPDSSDRIPAHR